MPVLIRAAARSPFALADHSLAGWHPVDLAAFVLGEACNRSGLDASTVDEVVVGCAEPVGAQGANMARAVVLAAGWSESTGGLVAERGESSGTAALHLGCAAIAAGQARTVAVIGVCSASSVQPGASALGRIYGRPWGDAPAQRATNEVGLLPLAWLADLAATKQGITAEKQHAWAERSRELRNTRHQAIVTVGARPGQSIAIQRDHPIDHDQPYQATATGDSAEPLFDPDGSTTAATFSPAADGISVIILQHNDEKAIGEILGTGRAAGLLVDPTGGAASALQTALKSAHTQHEAIQRWDITEPSAAAALVAISELHIDPALTNPQGGTLAVGDAGAAEDLRVVVDAVIESAKGVLGAAVVGGPTGGSAATIWRRL